MKHHREIDERSLAFGRVIASRIRQDRALIDRARVTIHRWLLTSSPRVRGTLEEWLGVLEGPLENVVDLLTGTSERAVRMRQSNPFTGVLSNQERNAILRKFASHDTKSA